MAVVAAAPSGLDLGDRTAALTSVSLVGWTLRRLSTDLQGDREIVLAAVSREPCALEFASSNLRDDQEVVLAAVRRNGSALKHASQNLRSDRRVALEAVANEGDALRYAGNDMQSDREIVMTAVANDGRALNHASPELAVEIAKDPMVQQQHLQRHFTFVMTMLSGRSCVHVVRFGGTPMRAVIQQCERKFGFDEGALAGAELLLGDVSMPDGPICCWPNLQPGMPMELQLLAVSRHNFAAPL
mmetsp:Transcript_28286/g.65619  ORF Transcript_28286/g.65619 Transcript_28286/m.65619 type:complete len:243 (+) Transcript_28286:75-803(+)